MPARDFLSYLKFMYPYLIKSYFVGKITKQAFYDSLSNLMVKFWQSGKNFYLTMSAVAATGPHIQNLISKKVQYIQWEKLPICLGVCYSDASLFYKSGPKLLTTHHVVRFSKFSL